MVVTLELLKSGQLLISKRFEDGSVATFNATASDNLLQRNGLPTGCICNLDTKKVISELDVLDGSCEVIERIDVDKFNILDRYINRGVAGECFEIR